MSPPKYLFLSLQSPAKAHLGWSDWNIDRQVYVQGVPVEGNDTPWMSFADLLVDYKEQYFVGLSFPIDKKDYWEPMKHIAQRLDSRVVRYNDMSTLEGQRIYAGESACAHRFEITWASASSLRHEVAQLCCGQWFWWYGRQGNWGVSPPIVALGVTDIDEVLHDHKLKFPKLAFPPLEVEFAVQTSERGKQRLP